MSDKPESVTAATFQPLPGDHWIDITSGMSGHFAVELWLNPEMDGFTEPWTTGVGRYPTRELAYAEAKLLAWSEDIPYIIHPELEAK